MISKDQIALNVMALYIERIRKQFATPTYLADQYLLILQIREWQLKRRLLGLCGRLEDLQPLRTGHHNAEVLHLEIGIGSRKELVTEIQNILQLLALEFHSEIVEIEAKHPEHRAEFARDKELIRLRWNNYVEQRQEAGR